MYKVLGIGGGILLILYKLFGVKALVVLLCIAVVLLVLIAKNQNKILYIPSTPPTT